MDADGSNPINITKNLHMINILLGRLDKHRIKNLESIILSHKLFCILLIEVLAFKQLFNKNLVVELFEALEHVGVFADE
ncbi:MAG: hypothetical protein HZRFUVUK_001650 [Candidatus Fervidibacterota bacterium]|jgi:hypothetical protein